MDERKTILVVDDTPANIDVLAGVLNTHYRVKAATSGERALKIAGGSSPPDLILLDIMMPEMDGYECIRRLKDDPSTAGIPVIFVTGHTDAAERDKGVKLGAVGYVSKPVDPYRIQAEVDKCLAP